MNKKKVFVFLPDGVGLRNFAYTDFKQIGEDNGFEIIYWNNSVFPLKERLGFEEVKIEKTGLHPLTPIYSRARKHIELNLWQGKFQDPVYATYKFPFSYQGAKNRIKSLFSKSLIATNSSIKGIGKIRSKIREFEKKNDKYDFCLNQLKLHRPDFVFCTSQRSTQAISALLAAEDLGIPTGTFIYSWDNVPKAMMVVDTDNYFVWSDLMKKQLLQYYPEIPKEKIFITGTPQFEPHYKPELIQPKEVFFRKYGLDMNKKYICFSGDDTTTSPLDQYYLEDLANAVKELNNEGEDLGIIFRRAPVDQSDRYDNVIKAYEDILFSLDPVWEPIEKEWNTILPLKEDFSMLATICEHSELVVNICSSMVFDFSIHAKPCIYINYEQPQLKKGIRDIGQNYNYVHFRSMPKNAVVWAHSKSGIKSAIKKLLDNPTPVVSAAKDWFKIVAGKSPNYASVNIWEKIETIT